MGKSFLQSKFTGIFIVLLFSFVAIKPLFITGFFPMHDDTQVARVFEMAKSLQAGMIPVRWVPDLGYGFGYPLFNFYGPFAYYIGVFFVVFGFDALMATKLMMGIGVIIAGVSMWFLAREFFGEAGGIVAGLFYLFAPYHALDIYVRGDVAEFYAYAILPLVFFGLYKIYIWYKYYTGYTWRWIGFTAFAYAALIASHNLTAMMVTPFIFIISLLYCSLAKRQKRFLTIRYTLYAIFLGLGISAFYWLPAILEMGKTNVLSQVGGGADYNDHFVCFSQLWDSPWGFGGSTKGCVDGLSFRVGKAHVIFSLVSICLAMIMFLKNRVTHLSGISKLQDKSQNEQRNSNAIFLAGIGSIVAMLFTLEISKPVWDMIHPMAFFQYPWRFLLLISFFTSFLAGAIPWCLKLILPKSYSNISMYWSSIIMLGALLYTTLKLFQPQTILAKTAADYTSDYAIKWIASKTSDEYLPKNFKKPEYPAGVFQQTRTIVYHQTPVEIFADSITVGSVLILLLGIIMGSQKQKRLLWRKKL